MFILLGLAIVPFFLKMLMGDIENDKELKKWFLISCGLIIICVIGFRHESVGTRDTSVYCDVYFRATKTSSLRKFFQTLSITRSNFLVSESLFYLFIWISARIFSSTQFLIFSTTAFVTISAMRFIYKHSQNVMLSVVMYISLGLMTFNANGMRQAVAMSVCLFAYDFVQKKRLVPFSLVVILATQFHKSAFFFFIVYVISYFKLNWKTGIFFAVASVLFLLLADRLAGLFDSFTGKDYAEGEPFETGGYITLIIYILTIIFALVAGKGEGREDTLVLTLLLAVVGAVLYVGRYISVQIYERMNYYFFYSLLLLLPQSLTATGKGERTMLVTIIYVLCILLFAYRLSGSLFENFEFCWR